MSKKIIKSGLQIDSKLNDLVENEIAPGTGVDTEHFWRSLADLVNKMGSENRALLDNRNVLQGKIDQWHADNPEASLPGDDYEDFLRSIGYLLPEADDFSVETQNVDAEIATIAGPQLVVPVDNARYALNATNARWGSLYDALYGTNIIDEKDGREKGSSYNPVRGDAVIARSNQFLNTHFTLADGNWSSATNISVNDSDIRNLLVTLDDGTETTLAAKDQFVGYSANVIRVDQVCLVHNGLHIIIQIDPEHPIGKFSKAGVKDVIIESAITTIQDFEDSVSAVDAEDKVKIYRNWTGIMKGTLEAEFSKGDDTIQRTLNSDRVLTGPKGDPTILPGRSMLLARNVGIHIYTDAVTTEDGECIPEGFLDAMVSSLAAIHDLKNLGKFTNSRAGSFYIVKPKLHGPEEVAFTVKLFGKVEKALGLKENTLKIGIMDEERRTSINLKACIREARERVVFINTGFLDRTGDEIHTSMHAGMMIPKMEIKGSTWILAYEDWNVDLGIATALPGKGQVGKGMWTAPDDMKTMMDTKQAHPKAGANTAWVPSPTAATLHALHYHAVDVFKTQEQLASREKAKLIDLLTPPILNRELSADEVQSDLENNAQGILGYVVRWIDQGIGCSKVPDIHNVGLMEDRATLRISSQHIANWLHHNLVTRKQVEQVFQKMAGVVNEQNAKDPLYQPMGPNFDGLAYQTALDLVFKGVEEPNGYTEAVLFGRRRKAKSLIKA